MRNKNIKRRHKMKTLKLLSIFLVLVCVSFSGYTEATKREAVILMTQGNVNVRQNGSGWIPAEVGMILSEKDIIKTAKDSFAKINISGKEEGSMVEINQSSQLMISVMIQDDKQESQETLLDNMQKAVKKIYS